MWCKTIILTNPEGDISAQKTQQSLFIPESKESIGRRKISLSRLLLVITMLRQIHLTLSRKKKNKNHDCNCFGEINSQSYLLQPPSTSPSAETHSESLSTRLAHSYLLYIVLPCLPAANCYLAHASCLQAVEH